LQRNRSIRERRTDLHDDAAIARRHAFQRGPRAPHEAEIRDVRDAPEIAFGHIGEARERGQHRVVDPYVDGAELGFDARGGTVERAAFAHVERDAQRTHAERAHVGGGVFERLRIARDHRDVHAASGEFERRRAAHARARSGDDHDPRLSHRDDSPRAASASILSAVQRAIA